MTAHTDLSGISRRESTAYEIVEFMELCRKIGKRKVGDGSISLEQVAMIRSLINTGLRPHEASAAIRSIMGWRVDDGPTVARNGGSEGKAT